MCRRQQALAPHMSRVGQNHTCIGIYGVCTVSLAGKSPYIRSYTVCIYGSDQFYIRLILLHRDIGIDYYIRLRAETILG